MASLDSEPGALRVGSFQSEFIQATDNGNPGPGIPVSESSTFPDFLKSYCFTPALVPELSVTSGPLTYYQAATHGTNIGPFSLDTNSLTTASIQSGSIDPAILNPPAVRTNKMCPGKFNTPRYDSFQISRSLLTNIFLGICAVGIGATRIRLERKSSSVNILTIYLRVNAMCVTHGFQSLPDIT